MNKIIIEKPKIMIEEYFNYIKFGNLEEDLIEFDSKISVRIYDNIRVIYRKIIK